MYRVTLILIQLLFITSCSIESQQCTKDDTLKLVSAGYTKEEISDICDSTDVVDKEGVVNERKNGVGAQETTFNKQKRVPAMIEGYVHDPFGNPLDGAEISIINSQFSIQTDKAGKYGIEYIPGKFTVEYSKEGYTTHELKLELSSSSTFPAADIILYPIPQRQWLYYVGSDGLIPMPESKIIKDVKERESAFSMVTPHVYSTAKHHNVQILSGKVSFVDTFPKQISLAKANIANEFFSSNLNGYESRPVYNGFKEIQETLEVIGKEKLLLRKFELSPGNYTWASMTKLSLGQAIPESDGEAFPFMVGSGDFKVLEESTPPLNYSDVGACPFECCSYREWMVNRDTALLESHETNANHVITLQKGARVDGVTGVVKVSPGRVRVTRNNRSMVAEIEYKKGDIIWVYTYLGEGIYKVWFKGKMYEEGIYNMDGNDNCQRRGACWLEVLSKPKSIWWVKIRNQNGVEGWSDKSENFDMPEGC